MNSTNEKYTEYNGTESYHKLIAFCHLKATDGVKAVAETESCYWFLDIIGSYQKEPKVQKQSFQVWKLQRCEGNSFRVSLEDGNDNVILTQDVEFSDYKDDSLTLWVQYDVLMLPSEY